MILIIAEKPSLARNIGAGIGKMVNKNGYLFVATEREGYNCECMVYNRSGEPVFKWDVSKSEFIDGDINPSNNAIVISLASAGEKKLVGEVLLINITNAKVTTKSTFDSQIFYCANFNSNDTFTLLGNNSLVYYNSDGTKRWTHKFEAGTLIKAEVSNHDSMVLAFSKNDGVLEGGSTEIKVINKLGKVSAKKTYKGTIDDISVGDSTVALGFSKKIYLTNEKLKDKKTITVDYNIKKIELYGDNKHIFVFGNSGGQILK